MSSSLTTTDAGSFCLAPLPEDYQPTENTVVLGRGKRIKELPGNRRLTSMVQDSLGAYSWADKTVKSSILMRIVNSVRDLNENQVGFVKQDNKTKRWYEASTLNARTTVAQVFRDANHGCYRSSKQSKQVRRRLEMAQQEVVPDNMNVKSTQEEASFVPPPPAFMRAITADQVSAVPSSFQRQQSLPMNMGRAFSNPLSGYGLSRQVSTDVCAAPPMARAVTMDNTCVPYMKSNEQQQQDRMGEFANSLRFLKQQEMHLQRQLAQSNMSLNNTIGGGRATGSAMMRFGSLLGESSQPQMAQQASSRSGKLGSILDNALDMLNPLEQEVAAPTMGVASLGEWNVDEEDLDDEEESDELLMIDPLPISEGGAFDAFLDDGLDVLDEVHVDDMRHALGVSSF